MVENIKDAEKIVLKERPGMRVLNTVELEKCFVVNVVPAPWLLVTVLTTILAAVAETTPFVVAFSAHT